MDPKNIQISKDGQDTNFWYQEKSSIRILAFGGDVRKLFTSHGFIPMEVCGEGEKAIRQYAEEKVKRDIAYQQLEVEWQNYFAAHANFPIMAVADDGTNLRGRIISIKDGKMSVRLDEPSAYRGGSVYNYHYSKKKDSKIIYVILTQNVFGENMSGFYQNVITQARNELIKIYERRSKAQITMS